MEKQKSLNILVVEDTKEEQDAAYEQLTNAGHIVTVVGTFRVAEKEIGNGKYDVLLTDIFFPFGAGIDWQGQEYFHPINKEKSIVPEALGYPLILFALQHSINKIGAISNANHHSGALAAMEDSLIEGFNHGKMIIPGVFFFSSSGNMGEAYRDEKGQKDWSRVLRVVTGQEEVKKAHSLCS